MRVTVTTVSLQVPERETLAGDGASVAASNRPRRPGILHVLVPHAYLRHLLTFCLARRPHLIHVHK
jgi:hypothetical protein